jgi:hypothetical protein
VTALGVAVSAFKGLTFLVGRVATGERLRLRRRFLLASSLGFLEAASLREAIERARVIVNFFFFFSFPSSASPSVVALSPSSGNSEAGGLIPLPPVSNSLYPAVSGEEFRDGCFSRLGSISFDLNQRRPSTHGTSIMLICRSL